MEKDMDRRNFLGVCSSGLAAGLLAQPSPASERTGAKPNIILFLVDDMGWQDTSVAFWEKETLFNRHYRTPNMERLARQGIRFTHAYAHAVCSPTRTSLMTGWHPARHHVTNWTLNPDKDTSSGWGPLGSPREWNLRGLQPETPSLARLLRGSGYFTIHCGKAHWGARGTPGENPCNLGFDVNIAGHAAGGPGSYQGLENFGNKKKGEHTLPWGIPGLEAYHGEDVNLSDALTREAEEALTRAVDEGKPFYLYMAHYAVHAPIQPHKRFVGGYRDRDYPGTGIDIPPEEEQYASMVEGMDASLGALLDHVDKLGVAESTLVIFTSDNGGFSAAARSTTPHGTGLNTHNWPLRAGKGSAYEGGTRVPFLAAWARPKADSPLQGQLPIEAGASSAQPIITEDLFPTVLGIARGSGRIPAAHPLDGRDIREYLLQRGTDLERPLHFHYPHVWGPRGPGYEPHSSLCVGAWKVVYFYIPRRWELYNIQEDIGEAHDLSGKDPERLERMATQLKKDLVAMGAQWPVNRKSGEEEPMLTPSELRAVDRLEIEVVALPRGAHRSLKRNRTTQHVLADEDWYNWGGSVLFENGEYHLFYARWPRKCGFRSWLTHSEIAHAVSSDPLGPYEYVETVLKGHGAGHWDQTTAHNAKIKRYDGKYYLYYIGSNGPYGEKELQNIARTGYRHPDWKVLRENQRTGVAIADSIGGPWRRLDKPVIEPSGPITTLTVNPAVTRGPDGTYFMIVKGDKPGTTEFLRNQALATAPSPEGPWTMQPNPVIEDFDTEDASMWYDATKGRFYAVFHAHSFIGMMTSKDGYAWERASNFEVVKKEIAFENGKAWKPDRMERPFVLTDEQGRPEILYVACKKDDQAVNIALPLTAR